MRDYPAVPNVFRINSSSSILLDDKHKISKNSEHEHLTMNGDVNYRHRNNGRIISDGPNNGGTACSFINIDGVGGNGNFALNCAGEDRLLSPIIKSTNDNVQQLQKRNNYALWIVTPVAARFVYVNHKKKKKIGVVH